MPAANALPNKRRTRLESIRDWYYYLVNVATDGILRIELGVGYQTEFGLGLSALDGLNAGFEDAQSVAGSGDIAAGAAVTVTTSEGFVVQEAARNSQSMSGDAGDDWETRYYFGGPQSYRGLSQYQVTAAAGDYFAPINNTGSFKRISAVAFEAEEQVIREPASLAMGLAGFGLIVARGRFSYVTDVPPSDWRRIGLTHDREGGF